MRLGISMPCIQPDGAHPTIADIRARARLTGLGYVDALIVRMNHAKVNHTEATLDAEALSAVRALVPQEAA